MKTIFRIIVMLALCAVAGAAAGQRFEWAKGFGTSEQIAVKGTVTDSLGNLYFLGQVDAMSEWDGEDFLPTVPMGHGATYPPAVVISKISPQGDLVWKKIVYNSKNETHATDIKPLGDTGFAVMFQYVPSSYYPYYPAGGSSIYWMDTLYTTEFYPISIYCGEQRFADKLVNAYVTFDFDGNVTEQHSLQISYVDCNGNDLMQNFYTNPDSLSFLEMWHMQTFSFDVDGSGNIYICRESRDALGTDYQANRGDFSAVKFWVDHKLVGETSLNHNPQLWFPQLLKFSPHFDTLLASRYVVQRCDNCNPSFTTWMNVEIDNDDNIYTVINHQRLINFNDTIYLDTIYGINKPVLPGNNIVSYLFIYDSLLTTVGYITLYDSVINPDFGLSVVAFYNIGFDYDSNIFVIAGSTGRGAFCDTTRYYSILQYNGESLNLKNDAFFMAFRRGTYPPELHSYGSVPAKIQSSIQTRNNNSIGNSITIANNRLFMQAGYNGGIRFPDRTISYSDRYKRGLGLVVLDYQGNVIDGKDYNAIGVENYPVCISLCDSILYLNTELKTEATFGDIHFYPDGVTECFAKYVDPAFMTTYVPPAPQGIGRPAELEFAVHPNPARDVLYVDTYGMLLEATAVSPLGVETPLPQIGFSTVDLSPLPPGVYLLRLRTTQGAASGRVAVVR